MYVSVDTGGTFTDIVAICSDGRIFLQKVLTSIDNPWKSISMGIKSVMDSCGEREGVIFHASTIATNMLLGQRGLETARSALLITSGFKDLLTIARQNRPRLYDPFFKKPRQLVPDELIYEVNERTLHSGEVVKKVDELEVESYLKDAVAKGAKSVAVVFINSYANPLNEDIAASIASKYFRFVIESSRASPSPREYERGSTAVVNAALMPKIHEYLSKLWDELRDMGFANLYVMSSSGGLLGWEDSARSPSRIVESGPAAGVVGASIMASLLGIERAIAFDMGGTTAKASSIINGVASLTNEYEVGGESHHGRLVKGSGYPVRGSFIDLAEVSAGGGTVIWRDKAGAIRVGPHSVGSMPGPMCYGLGGDEPTITDANVALGRIPPGYISGGIKLSEELALKGLSRLGDPSLVAAEAIGLANMEMARAIRLVTVERGHDPELFSLIAYGGGGPLHASGVANEIGVRSIVVPPFPGLFSSLGILLSDHIVEVSAFVGTQELTDVLRSLESRALSHASGLGSGRVSLHRFVEARYKGQGWELMVELPGSDDFSLKKIFDEAHERTYGYSLDEDVEAVVAHVIAVAENPLRKDILSRLSGRARTAFFDCRSGYTSVFIDGSKEKVPVYCRYSFVEDVGPAVIIDYGSTIFVDKGWRAWRDELGVIKMKRD